MGKAKGDPARSKTRPSSSSLAASLVQGSGPVAFGGFGGYVGSARVEPAPAVDGDILLEVDGEAALHLRRLSKKDPTTKLKALAALRTFFQEQSGSSLASLVPAWIFEYKRLVQDNSRQVRESTHHAMSDLATAIGRGLAPHLRGLMGAWWVSQFDSSREVADAAQHSLQVAFPNQKKRVDALVYSLNDILSYLDETLRLTPQTISDKSTPIDESTEKYERVMSSSILAIAALLDVLIQPLKTSSESASSSIDEVPSSSREAEISGNPTTLVADRASRLCHDHKFFQGFVKSKSSTIRAATYQVLRAFIQHVPEVFATADQNVVVGVVLGAFSERDPSSHQPLWEMVLFFARTFPHLWHVNSVRKVVIPRLWGFLRHGCYGSQQVSYQYLLPLLSLVPPKAVTPCGDFLLDFFSNLWQGLGVGLLTPVDRRALLKVLSECLIWVATNASRYADEDNLSVDEFQSMVIESVLFKCLWCQYLGLGTPAHGSTLETRDQALSSAESTATGQLSGHLVSDSRIVAMGFPEQFATELASCVVDLLTTFTNRGDGLLTSFWPAFHTTCLTVIQEAGNRSKQGEDNLRVARLSKFFVVLSSQNATSNSVRGSWPLTQVVRPFICRTFLTIKTSGHREAVRVLTQLAAAYGRTAFSELWKNFPPTCSNSSFGKACYTEQEDLFKLELLSWCLDGNDAIDSKVEFLLIYVGWAEFEVEWTRILLHLIQEDSLERMDDRLKAKQVLTLAALVRNVREKAMELAAEGDVKTATLVLEQSQNKILDGVALSIVKSADLANPSALQLLRYLLGSQQTSVSMVSTPAAALILKELLDRLLSILGGGELEWGRNSARIILSTGEYILPEERSERVAIRDDEWLLAKCALDVVGDCIHTMLALDVDFKSSAQVMAAVYCLKWAFVTQLPNIGDDLEDYGSEDEPLDYVTAERSVGRKSLEEEEVSTEQRAHSVAVDAVERKYEFVDSLKVISGIVLPFCEKLRPLSKNHLQWILSRCIRCAVFETDHEEGHQLIRRCGSWVLELATHACQNAEDLDQTMDYILASSSFWPLWTEALPRDASHLPLVRIPGNQKQDIAHKQFSLFLEILPAPLVFFSHILQSRDCKENSGQWITVGDRVYFTEKPCRIWVAIELLCTWQWPSGGAMSSILPFLKQCGQYHEGSAERELVDSVVHSLFVGASTTTRSKSEESLARDIGEDHLTRASDRCLMALLMLLKGMLEKDHAGAKVDALKIFREHIMLEEGSCQVPVRSDLRILPQVLSVIMPVLRRRVPVDLGSPIKQKTPSCDEDWSEQLESTVLEWLRSALSCPPLVECQGARQVQDAQLWVSLGVSCFPLNPSGGAAAIVAASTAGVASEERAMLLALLRKQYSREAVAAIAAKAALRRSGAAESLGSDQEQDLDLCLAKLVAVAIAYCWQDFTTEDWEFVLSRLRKWLEGAVVSLEDFTESVVEAINNETCKDALENTVANVAEKQRISTFELASTAVSIFSLVKEMTDLEGIGGTDSVEHLKEANWERAEGRAMEDILRLLLATGLAEAAAVASEVAPEVAERARVVIATIRKEQGLLWDYVAEVALRTSERVREAAVRAADLWGLGFSAIGALYALLFSPEPVDSLQWTVYHFLSSNPLDQRAVSVGILSTAEATADEKQESSTVTEDDDLSSAVVRPELSLVLETQISSVQNSPLTSPLRVRYFLGWSLFLSRIQNLPALSQARDRLVQYAQDSNIPSRLLECLFQHIHLERSSSGLRKMSTTRAELSGPAAAAMRAASTGSITFAVEGLWPVGKESIAILAGGIYGLMLRVLPACVRIWFTGLQNKGFTSAVEAFTTAHCSPQLLADEFSQVQASAVADETLSIRANRTTREVTAIYKKEEAGMDIVIRLPASYPLRAVEVDCTRRMGISETRLRKWILSMAAFLRNQNGAVSEAVQIWKGNVDREFEGVEECPICYSITHTSNHSLPKLACKTCKHKFHAACLYKWFSTSHKSTCPLCQTPF